MKKFSVILALVLSYSLNGFSQVAQVNKSQPLKVEAQCARDEIAFIGSKPESYGASSTFSISVECRAADCIVINDSSTNKVTIVRSLQSKSGIKGVLNQPSDAEFRFRNQYRSQVLLENVAGGKDGGIAEGNRLVNEGICKKVDYVYTNKVIQFINSL